MRVIKTNKWSIPALETLREEEIDFSEVIERIAELALNPDLKDSERTFTIQGKYHTLRISTKLQ